MAQDRQEVVLGAVGLLGGSLGLLGGNLGLLQGLADPLPLNGVVDCAGDRPRVGLALDQVVLRAATYGLVGDLLVRQTRDHQDRQRRRGGANPHDRVQSVRIGKREVQEDRIEVLHGKAVQRVAQGTRPENLELPLERPARTSPATGRRRGDCLPLVGCAWDRRSWLRLLRSLAAEGLDGQHQFYKALIGAGLLQIAFRR